MCEVKVPICVIDNGADGRSLAGGTPALNLQASQQSFYICIQLAVLKSIYRDKWNLFFILIYVKPNCIHLSESLGINFNKNMPKTRN